MQVHKQVVNHTGNIKKDMQVENILIVSIYF